MVTIILPGQMTNKGVELVKVGDSERWHLDGILHRENKPAVIFDTGETTWIVHGKIHREDGPAYSDLLCDAWFINGERHREDGPAIQWHNGSRSWYLNGKRHREDGPAEIDVYAHDIGYEWWINNNRISDAWIKENIIDWDNVTEDERILMRLTWM